MNKVLQAQYAKLCQELGDLENRKRRLESRLQAVRAHIDALDLAAGFLEPKMAAVSAMPAQPQGDRTGSETEPSNG